MSERIGNYREDWSLRKRESKASSGRLATIKMVAATLRKNFGVDLVRDSRYWVSEQIRVTAMNIAAIFSDQSVIQVDPDAKHPVDAFVNKSKVIKEMIKVKQLCKEGDYMRARWLYAGDYFAENVDFHTLDRKVAKGELPSHAGQVVMDAEEKEIEGSKVIVTPWLDSFLTRLDDTREKYENRIGELEEKIVRTPNEDAHLMRYKHKLHSNKFNPLAFDPDGRIADAMARLIDSLIVSITIDEESKKNIAHAHELALQTGKKLIFNFNHAWHSDSYVAAAFYKFLLQNDIIPGKNLPLEEQKRLRFLCGFYMALTPGLRQYLRGMSVLLVPGLNDMDFFAKKLGARKTAQLFSYIKKGWAADSLGEIWVIFSGGGRWPYGGLKEDLPKGTYRYLEDPDTIIVDIHMTNTDKIYMADFNAIAVFNRWAPQQLTFACGEPYVGKKKSREQIFASMVKQRDELQPQWKGAEKIHLLQEEIIKFAGEIKELQRKIDKLPREAFLISNGQHELANQIEQERGLYEADMAELVRAHTSLQLQHEKLLASNEVGSEAAKIDLMKR